MIFFVFRSVIHKFLMPNYPLNSPPARVIGYLDGKKGRAYFSPFRVDREEAARLSGEAGLRLKYIRACTVAGSYPIRLPLGVCLNVS